MHIAIDDTYGPSDIKPTRYVTGNRRTAIGIAFPDDQVDNIRDTIVKLLNEVNMAFIAKIDRFHFVDIFNRINQWSEIKDESNIELIDLFAEIYFQNQWKVYVTTVDDRTLDATDDFPFNTKIDKFDLSNRAHQAMVLLLCKIRRHYDDCNEKIYIHIDEGIYHPDSIVNLDSFLDPSKYLIKFNSSSTEPLLQWADFMAYSINRVTHLSIKENKSEFDYRMLNFFSTMNINSDDLITLNTTGDLTIPFYDSLHDIDRITKDLPLL